MKFIFYFFYFFNTLLYGWSIDDIIYDIKSIYYQTTKKSITTTTNIKNNIKIFDATLYRQKIKSNEALFPKIHIIYQRDLWSNWDDIESRKFVDVQKIEKTAKELKYSDTPYIIDIEHWNVHTTNDKIANENINKYIKVIKIFKRIRPELKFGFYSVLPNRDYWSSLSNSREANNEWNQINQRLKKLAKYVDVISPSLYTFYDKKDDWTIYAMQTIKKAKEYKKPIYAFIWPQYHNSNKKLAGKYIDKSFWELQLKTLQNANVNIVIWGGYNLSKENYGPLIWNENLEWWKTTKKFIHSIKR